MNVTDIEEKKRKNCEMSVNYYNRYARIRAVKTSELK